MNKSGEQVSTLFHDDLPVDFCHSSATEGVVSGARTTYITVWFGLTLLIVQPPRVLTD